MAGVVAVSFGTHKSKVSQTISQPTTYKLANSFAGNRPFEQIAVYVLLVFTATAANMPGLLDLPPWLIEQIFDEHNELLWRQYHETVPRNATARGHPKRGEPLFRLTNRYTERATRRLFINFYFRIWRITTPNDASIQDFCAMAKVPDIARSLTQLNLFLENDTVPRSEQPTSLSQFTDDVASSLAVSHSSNDPFDTPASAAYVRNSADFIDALAACANIREL